VLDSTDESVVGYGLDGGPAAGEAVGSTGRAGLASFLAFCERTGVWDALGARVRLPVQERRTGFTQRQKHQALVAALAAGCRRARDGDFVLKPDPAARAALGLARWPHSSQLTRHLRAFRAPQVAGLRAAVEEVTATHAAARRRLRRGERVVVDLDQTPIAANGRTYQGTARGRLKKKGDRGYQATAVFAGDTGGGEDGVLAVFLDPGNAHATWRFADALDAPGARAGAAGVPPRAGAALRLPVRHRRRPGAAAAPGGPLRRARLPRRDRRRLGARPRPRRALGGAQPGQVGLRARRRAGRPQPPGRGLPPGPGPLDRRAPHGRLHGVGALHPRHRAGRAPALEGFYEARQTIEGWFSEATAALQLKGLWSRSFCGLEAFLLLAALTSNLLNWWTRRALLPGAGLPHLGLRQLVARVVAVPARVLRAPDGRLLLLLPPTHPYARRLVRDGPGWQPPIPLAEVA
jgi:hypothetical protein